MRDPEALLGTAEDVVARARARGASEAEAYVCTVEGSSLSTMGSVVTARDLGDGGIGLRIIADGRAAATRVYGVSERAVEIVVENVLGKAREMPEPRELPSFADPSPLAALTVVHPALADPDPERLASESTRLAEALRAGDEVTFSSTTLDTVAFSFAVANSRGVAAWDRDAVQLVTLAARATRSGVSRTATDQMTSRAPVWEHADPADVARAAVERARGALKPSHLPRPVDEAVMDPVCVAQLLDRWVPALSGHLVAGDRTPLAGKVGERIASEHLTILDAPHSPRGPRGQRMDDEGTPTRDRALVERGVLKTFLYSATAAARAGTKSTGNAYRPMMHRWTGGLGIKPANVRIEPGTRDLDALVADVDRGVLLVDGLLGAFASNSITGDLAAVAPLAYYVERGTILHALPHTTVGCNVHEALKNVLAVGRDAKPLTRGEIPALHVTGVACAT